jgi:myo-inositol 2-dehydrogenase / D-chiro-inositol 1-dehydrogenase
MAKFRGVTGVASVAEIALVGAGRMGGVHLRALADAPSIRVTDVVEPYAPRREQCAAAGLRAHATVQDLLASRTPDGVLVCAPTDQHAAVVRHLLATGVPVLCEKPAGSTWQEVAETGRIAATGEAIVQVAYWRRFVPRLVALRERIAAGEFGQILHLVCAQWDSAPPPRGFRATSGGIFVDMGVHEFDQIRWLTGREIEGVQAVTTPAVDPEARPDADVGQALLRLTDSTTAVVSLGRHHPVGDLVSVEVFGTAGHQRLVVLDPADGEASMLDALRRQAESFAELLGTGVRRGAGIEDAVAAMRTADSVSNSADHPH